SINMVNALAEEALASNALSSTSNGDSIPPVTKDIANRQSQTSSPVASKLKPPQPTTTSAAEIANPDHPHHRHHRTINDFELMGTLGEGSYSTVLAAKDKKTGQSYAIKVLDKFHIIREKKQKYVNIEKLALIRMNHPGIVSLYWTLQDRNSLCRILGDFLEYREAMKLIRTNSMSSDYVITLAPHGELLTYIKKLGSFDLATTQFYAAEILSALEHVHSKKVIHRDVKPENILLDENMHIKLTDFGSAKLLDEDEAPISQAPPPNEDVEEGRRGRPKANSFVGTAEYVSPELLSARAASTASDFWALGCIIYQLLAGKPPFKGATDWLTFGKIQRLEYTFPGSFPVVAKDLVQKLLVLDPQVRLGSDETGGVEALKAHAFFEGVQWDQLFASEAPKLRPFLPKMDGMNEYDLTSENNVFFQRQGHSFDDIARDPFEDDYGSEARISM
ncbi:hypothetical protein INT44_000649, partial [Umbelopsis vinacea]